MLGVGLCKVMLRGRAWFRHKLFWSMLIIHVKKTFVETCRLCTMVEWSLRIHHTYRTRGKGYPSRKHEETCNNSSDQAY